MELTIPPKHGDVSNNIIGNIILGHSSLSEPSSGVEVTPFVVDDAVHKYHVI